MAFQPLRFLGSFWNTENTNNNTEQTPSPPAIPTPIINCLRALSLSTLSDRARTNWKLTELFGIENGLTSTDPSIHHHFLTNVHQRMATRTDEWAVLADIAHRAIQHHINNMTFHFSIDITLLIQAVVLRILLKKIFKIREVADGDLQFMAHKLNGLLKQFYYSRGKIIPSIRGEDWKPLFQQDDDLKVVLERIFRPINETENSQPFDILIPAYEALWPVILRCFIHMRFKRSPEDCKKYNEILRSFLRNPTPCTLDINRTSLTPSARNIVEEALRLYPPTTRIFRETEYQKIEIDIEKLHRETSIYGHDSHLFRPERWIRDPHADVPAGYIPYGYGALTCPASRQFAPMIIAILVSVLMHVFQGEELEVESRLFFTNNGKDCHDVLGRREEPLKNEWEVYRELSLCQYPPDD